MNTKSYIGAVLIILCCLGCRDHGAVKNNQKDGIPAKTDDSIKKGTLKNVEKPDSGALATNNYLKNITRSRSKQPEKVSGFLVFGIEVQSFRPCDSDKQYWWEITDDISWNDLQTHYKGITTKPYEKVFAELLVEEKGKPTDGFSAAYENVLLITEIVEIRPINTDDCK